MSLHQTIYALNLQGERLATNVQRLQHLGTMLGGPQPPRDKLQKGGYPAGDRLVVAESIEGKFDKVVSQYASVIDDMIEYIDRLDQFILDNGPEAAVRSTERGF